MIARLDPIPAIPGGWTECEWLIEGHGHHLIKERQGLRDHARVLLSLVEKKVALGDGLVVGMKSVGTVVPIVRVAGLPHGVKIPLRIARQGCESVQARPERRLMPFPELVTRWIRELPIGDPRHGVYNRRSCHQI